MDINSKIAVKLIERGQIDILEKLPHEYFNGFGIDIFNKIRRGQTLLNVAVESRNVEIVKLLLTKGAYVNNKDIYGNSPLHKAVCSGQEAMVRILLEADADVNARDKRGHSPLSLALGNSITCDRGRDMETFQRNQEAVCSRNTEITKLLLFHGADMDSINDWGHTALYEATNMNNIEMVRFLLDRGADVNAKIDYGKNTTSSLHAAVLRNNLDIVKLLVAHGAYINPVGGGYTGLNTAIFYGRRDIVNVLLDNGADLTISGDSGDTALHEAAYYGYLELLEHLIEKGAKVDAKNKSGETPLHRGTRNFRDDNNYKNDLLFFYEEDKIRCYTMIEPTSTDIINVLINNGADIEAKNRNQETPLFSAVRHKNLSLVDFLLDNGADINHKSTCGTTCLNSCDATGNKLSGEMITLLQRHIIKQKSAGFYMNKDNLEKYPFDMFEYQTECSKEILYLKNEFIYDGISLFGLLSKSTTQLTYYLDNSDISKSVNLSKCKTNSLQYYNIIYNKFQNAARRNELLKYGEMFFDGLPILPYVCRKHILSYLSNADLIILQKLVK